MKVYLVGGAVRDAMLGYPVLERDWVVVGATPETMLADGYTQVGKDFPVFIHPRTGEEYALARTERKVGRGYGGFTCFSSPDITLEGDLKRRDLTINAMAEDADGVLYDPFGGAQDLKNKVLRHVSEAFIEDPLRVLRLARFAARFSDFRVAPETMQYLKNMVQSGELNDLTKARVWQEVAKALVAAKPVRFMEILEESGAKAVLFSDWQVEAWNGIEKVPAELPVRFSLAAWSLSTEAWAHIKTILPLPSICISLVEALQTSQRWLATADDSAEAYLALYQMLDAFRQHALFGIWLKTVLWAQPLGKLLFGNAGKMYDTILAVRLTEVEAQGHQGAAYGKALHKKRLETIQRLLDR